MRHSTRLRSLAGALVLLAGLSTVAACGDSGGTTVSTKDGKVKVDHDKITVETSEGTATIGKGLPEGFPKDDVPLLDEDVLSGVRGTSGGPFAWSVVMKTSRSVEDVTAEVKKDFADAGYTEGQGTAMGDVAVLQFTSAKYDVGVTAARTSGEVTISYVVKDAG
jgi:hypothetical protein